MIRSFEGITPTIGHDVFVAENATVLGDVRLGEQASVWYGAVLRADVGTIAVGARSNIQELTVIHMTAGENDITIGDDVTVGHRAMLHGCTILDLVLVGMGSTIMDGAVIQSQCIIGAGSLVTPRTVIPPGVLALGSPCKPVRDLTPDELESLKLSSQKYLDLSARHRANERLLRAADSQGKPGVRRSDVWRSGRSER